VRRFIAARLAQSAIIIVIVTVVAFLLLHLVPGDPFIYDSPNITPAIRNQWRAQFGYDRPVGVQLIRYLTSVAHGNFGYSIMQHRPARDAIADALPQTLVLASLGVLGAVFVGIVMGSIAGAKRRTWWDKLISLYSVLFYSIPEFWLALIIQIALAYSLRLFPVSGTSDPLIAEYGGRWQVLNDHLRHLALPMLTIALIVGAIVTRFQRAALLDVLPSDYLRTARAKGVAERQVITRHALRNALTPTITVLGLLFPSVLGGAYFVEYVFSWHGLGLLTVNAVQSLDYDVAAGSVIISAVLVVLGSLTADILTAIADPRLRDG
jgi:peptide/nickel transport system permease protein